MNPLDAVRWRDGSDRCEARLTFHVPRKTLRDLTARRAGAHTSPTPTKGGLGKCCHRARCCRSAQGSKTDVRYGRSSRRLTRRRPAQTIRTYDVEARLCAFLVLGPVVQSDR